MEYASLGTFNDDSLREELAQAGIRLRIALLLAKRLAVRKPTLQEFLKQVIQVEQYRLSMIDIVLIGECFGFGSYDVRIGVYAMIAEGRAAYDCSFHIGPLP